MIRLRQTKWKQIAANLYLYLVLVFLYAPIAVIIIDQCVAQGVPFAREYGGMLANRSFGGAQVSRTFYAKGQTGQQLLLAQIIDAELRGRDMDDLAVVKLHAELLSQDAGELTAAASVLSAHRNHKMFTHEKFLLRTLFQLNSHLNVFCPEENFPLILLAASL